MITAAGLKGCAECGTLQSSDQYVLVAWIRETELASKLDPKMVSRSRSARLDPAHVCICCRWYGMRYGDDKLAELTHKRRLSR